MATGRRDLFGDAAGGRTGGRTGAVATPREAAPASLDELTSERYRTYALSVITSRALPDVRDGLKPVQRRILTTMWRQGLRSGGRFRKSAKVVGDVMGALHPHGDSAIYEALVRMAQPFATRLPLIEGSGNFGSLDGDPAAAMRYTECRLSPAADEVLADIAADTVEHRPTYDGSGSEPVVLPTRLPLLLVNGSTGIAVGVATSIPPHNLVEILDALVRLLDEPDLEPDALAGIVRGPDFPTGGEILDPPERLAQIYAEGKGAVRVRGTVEDGGVRGRVRTLYLTSIPYGVNKAQLVERLGEIVADRSLPALLEVSDLSTDDVRIRLEVQKEVDPAKIVAFLGRRTPFASPIQVDLTCLRFDRSPGGAPERVGLRPLLLDFLAFRREVVRRRLDHERGKLNARLRLLAGFARVFEVLDRVLEIIRASDGKADAAGKIIEEVGLDAEQTDAVLELRLYRLARLEIRVIREEMEERRARLAEVERLLASPQAITAEVRADLVEIRDRRAAESARRTRFASAGEDPDFAEEDFLPDEDAILILSRDGWIRRQREVREPRKLRLREGDALLALAQGSTRASFVLFSSLGRAFTARIAAVPATTGHGVPVRTLFALGDGEKIVNLVSLDPRALPAAGSVGAMDAHGFAVTRAGNALRFRLAAFTEPSNRNGRRFARLEEEDAVLGAGLTRGVETLIVVTRGGRALLCDIEEINLLAGAGRGVRAVKLAGDDEVLGFRLARRGERLVAETPGGGSRVIAPGEKFVPGPRGRRGQLVNKAGFVRVRPDEIAPPEPLGGSA